MQVAAVAAAVWFASPLAAIEAPPYADYPHGLTHAVLNKDGEQLDPEELVDMYRRWIHTYVEIGTEPHQEAEYKKYTGAGTCDPWLNTGTSTNPDYDTPGSNLENRLRVRRDVATFYDTVSEGQAYGMLLAVYFDDKDTFDKLYRYAKDHFATNLNLMQWMVRGDGRNMTEYRIPFEKDVDVYEDSGETNIKHLNWGHGYPFIYKTDINLPDYERRYISSNDPLYREVQPGKTESEQAQSNLVKFAGMRVLARETPTFLQAAFYERSFSSALDADMDMAIALCFAEARWGGKRDISRRWNRTNDDASDGFNYRLEALLMIRDIMDECVVYDGTSKRYILKAGSKWGSRDGWNPSYFMPAWLRIFRTFVEKSAGTPELLEARKVFDPATVDIRTDDNYERDGEGKPVLVDVATTFTNKIDATIHDMYLWMKDINDNNGGCGLYPDWAAMEQKVTAGPWCPKRATLTDRIYYKNLGGGKYSGHQTMSFNCYYDGVRVPWRIGMDYSMGDPSTIDPVTERPAEVPEAKAILTEIANFCSWRAWSLPPQWDADGNKIRDGYGLVDGYSITGGDWNPDDADGFNPNHGGRWHSNTFVTMFATSTLVTWPQCACGHFTESISKWDVADEAFELGTRVIKQPNHYFGNVLQMFSVLYLSGRMGDLTVLCGGPAGSPPPPSVKVEHMTYNTTDLSNTLSVNVRLTNNGPVGVQLGSLKASYWFKAENVGIADVAEKDVAFLKSSGKSVGAKIVVQPTSRGGQNRSATIGFPNASDYLSPGDYVEVHFRIHKSNWTNYSQANDYSFRSTGAFIKNEKIPVYFEGNLVGGIEP